MILAHWSHCMSPHLLAAAFDGLELRVKGNGLRYKCIIRTDPGWDAVGYTLAFDTQDNGESPAAQRQGCRRGSSWTPGRVYHQTEHALPPDRACPGLEATCFMPPCLLRFRPTTQARADAFTLAPPRAAAGWQTVRLPFADFKPVFRARTMPGMPPLNAANICSVQLMFRWVWCGGCLYIRQCGCLLRVSCAGLAALSAHPSYQLTHPFNHPPSSAAQQV